MHAERYFLLNVSARMSFKLENWMIIKGKLVGVRLARFVRVTCNHVPLLKS